MGFDGLVLTDTICMWAILKNFPVPRACAMALEAGCDMFFLKDPPRYPAALEAVRDSIRAGRLTEERVEQSVRRVLRLNLKHGLFGKRFDEAAFAGAVGAPAHRRAALDLARRSLVVLRNDGGLLPLREPRRKTALALVPREMAVIQANDTVRDHGLLPRALEGVFGEVQHVMLDPGPTELQLFEAAARARNADVVVDGVMAGGWTPGLAAAAEIALDMDLPVVALLACAPQVLARLPRKVAAAVCAFCDGPQQFESFAERLVTS